MIFQHFGEYSLSEQGTSYENKELHYQLGLWSLSWTYASYSFDQGTCLLEILTLFFLSSWCEVVSCGTNEKWDPPQMLDVNFPL